MSNALIWTGVGATLIGLLVAVIGGLPLGGHWPRPTLPRTLQAVGAALLLEGVILLLITAIKPASGAKSWPSLLLLVAAAAFVPPAAVWYLRRSQTDAPDISARGWSKFGVTLGALVAIVGVFYLATPACACVTPEQKAKSVLQDDMRRVIATERAHFDSTGRYAISLDSLTFEARDGNSLTLVDPSDSAFRLEGRTMSLPGYHCVVEVTPAITSETPLGCTTAARGSHAPR